MHEVQHIEAEGVTLANHSHGNGTDSERSAYQSASRLMKYNKQNKTKINLEGYLVVDLQ